MHCPASQAPLAGPIGLQILFSIFSKFTIGENGRMGMTSTLLWGKTPWLCQQYPAPGSNPSACPASLAPHTSAQVFSSPQMCSPEQQPGSQWVSGTAA